MAIKQIEIEEKTLTEDETNKDLLGEVEDPILQDNEKENFTPKERAGNPVYTDKLFKAILEVLKTDNNIKRNGVLFQQYGTKLTIYQGNPGNVWGYIEALHAENENKETTHRIKIFSTILRKIFLKNKITKSYFKEVI